MILEDQTATVAFLRRHAGRSGEPPETIVTHISTVVLGGGRALKLKRRAVAERHLAACEAELRLNRRTAPEIYLAVKTSCTFSALARARWVRRS